MAVVVEECKGVANSVLAQVLELIAEVAVEKETLRVEVVLEIAAVKGVEIIFGETVDDPTSKV